MGLNLNPGANVTAFNGMILWDTTMSGNSPQAVSNGRLAAVTIGIEDYKNDLQNDPK